MELQPAVLRRFVLSPLELEEFLFFAILPAALQADLIEFVLDEALFSLDHQELLLEGLDRGEVFRLAHTGGTHGLHRARVLQPHEP